VIKPGFTISDDGLLLRRQMHTLELLGQLVLVLGRRVEQLVAGIGARGEDGVAQVDLIEG